MSVLRVASLMLPLSECATVPETATLRETISVMEATRMMFQRWDYRPRIVLVFDKNHKIVGSLRHFDVLRGLEPKYKQLGEMRSLARLGFSPESVVSIKENFRLWNHSLETLCKNLSEISVGEIMSTITEQETIHKGALITDAIHRMLMGNYPSLFVREKSEIQGILRMCDVGEHVFKEIKRTNQFREVKSG
ncbi:CBS domain-containing protein [Desulfomonile tiedjei]|uniref:CBS domain-containing protein n=1 Tax=Desulfomonile tiedjei (strain ATCC 49306 / DSM 6799 / DCB-1) TaxID=706587 RepID=I4C3W3_DESTA|nr:CBS domain-containing protein [Desulfomonile tiedjei]AFM24254.1 CBS domain-containing protein [Desulfomonile tiedjei DSM 6799]